jgi:SAM-dependent methyltransferase
MQVYPLNFTVQNTDPNPISDFFCLICGQTSPLRIVDQSNLREDCRCAHCGSFNRQRQLAFILLKSLLNRLPGRESLQNIPDISAMIFNTESTGALHQVLLEHCENYSFSEYFGAEYSSGSYIGPVMHQDLMKLSFLDNSLDVILSSDVFEHIPDPYLAFSEIHRVLKPNGRHIFTVPFHQNYFLDDVRAVVKDQKISYLADPIYHGDPVRPEKGALVYTIFSLEMLVKLAKLGFNTPMYRLYQPEFGILGNNGLVFESIKI